jgi:hypothetical protein
MNVGNDWLFHRHIRHLFIGFNRLCVASNSIKTLKIDVFIALVLEAAKIKCCHGNGFLNGG